MFPDVPADLDPKVKAQLLAYAASAEPWRKTEIQIALGQLAAITNSKPKNAEERAAKIEATAKQKELLANLQSGAKFPEPVIDANDPKTGDVGRIVTVFYLHDSVRKVPTKTLFQFEPFEHSEHLNKWERARIEAAKASQKK